MLLYTKIDFKFILLLSKCQFLLYNKKVILKRKFGKEKPMFYSLIVIVPMFSIIFSQIVFSYMEDSDEDIKQDVIQLTVIF